MKKHNPKNERVKHNYRSFLKEAKQLSEASVDAVESSLAMLEKYNGYTDFKKFHFKQAIGFKKHLAKQTNQKTGKPLSKSTMNRTLNNLKTFFQWLTREPGYKSVINYSDAEYFNMSEKDVRIASARRKKSFPAIEQIQKVISVMPAVTDIEKRDRALIAFTALTAARISAIASFKLKHIDLHTACVHQDAREVRTKFSKTFDTYLFESGEGLKPIFCQWVNYLRTELLWGEDDPLFPSTAMVLGPDMKFCPNGLAREHWQTTGPIRRIFKTAFSAAELPYFNPHSFRDTLTMVAHKKCRNAEELRAFSQNFGHENVMTTFANYGEVSSDRQAEIISGLGANTAPNLKSEEEIVRAVMRELNSRHSIHY